MSGIPCEDFVHCKREIFKVCEELMTDKLHKQYRGTERSLIRADVKTFLGAHIVDATRLTGKRVSRRSSTFRISSTAPIRRRPAASRARLLSSSRPAIDSASSSTTSMASTSALLATLSTPRRIVRRVDALTPASRMTPRSTGAPSKFKQLVATIDFGTLSRTMKTFNGNRDRMISHLIPKYPHLTIDDIAKDVDMVISTLAR